MLRSTPINEYDDSTGHGIVVRADARAMGAVSAFNTTNRRKPRTYTRASDCISYYKADKSDAVIYKSARAEKRATSRRSGSASAPKRFSCYDMQPIGDSNH